ncbi:MAG: VWA domain-containing protein [Bacteroidetes bacterium]|nr:MAG: VWA domain-containing protein [Bacteroidota bacterium]
MTWYGNLENTEWAIIGLFLLFYLLYLAKVRKVAIFLNTSANRVFWKFGLRAAYFSLIIISILGPSFGEMKKEIKSVGKDIYVAVDLSQSMSAIDVQPSRIEKIKYELKNMVSAFNSDRIGLIIFSSEAFMQCPLTFDQEALNLFIETLSTRLVPNTGTDFAPALKMALERHLEEDKNIRNQAKVVVLISDGEDFGEETKDIAKEMRDKEIKTFTVGVGTAQGSKIPFRNGFKQDESGSEVVSVLNANALKELADITGGQYFEVNDKQNDIPKLIASIAKIKGDMRDTRQIDVSANKYFYFLLAALFLAIFDVLLTIKIIRL